MIQVVVLWVVILCSGMAGYKTLEAFAASCLQKKKMEVASSSETWVSCYITTWHHILEDGNMNLHHCENLKPHYTISSSPLFQLGIKLWSVEGLIEPKSSRSHNKKMKKGICLNGN
jgi:hypothetical protein